MFTLLNESLCFSEFPQIVILLLEFLFLLKQFSLLLRNLTENLGNLGSTSGSA